MLLPSVHIGIQTLRANPVRTLLSTLGIVMGAASLVGVLSLSDGAQTFARKQLELRGVQAVAVTPKTADIVDGLSIPRATFPIFSIDDARALSGRVMRGATVAMTTEGTGTFVTTAAGPPRAASVTGVYGSPDAVLGGIAILHGRFLTEAEMTADAAVAVVSNKLARELATGGRSLANLLTTPLLLQGRQWTIVGVYDAYPNERNFAVTVPLPGAPRAILPSSSLRPRNILVRAPRMEDVLSVQAQVEAWADATNPQWRAAPQISINSTGIERLRQLNQGMLILKLLMGAFTAISLVVGGIGIMNVLLASVVERTREIGLRKATGARRRDIIIQFLAESVTISLAGAIIGAVVGGATALGATAIIRWQASAPFFAVITWQSVTISMSAAVAIGLIFGVYPALKAARLSPVDAMRYE